MAQRSPPRGFSSSLILFRDVGCSAWSERAVSFVDGTLSISQVVHPKWKETSKEILPSFVFRISSAKKIKNIKSDTGLKRTWRVFELWTTSDKQLQIASKCTDEILKWTKACNALGTGQANSVAKVDMIGSRRQVNVKINHDNKGALVDKITNSTSAVLINRDSPWDKNKKIVFSRPVKSIKSQNGRPYSASPQALPGKQKQRHSKQNKVSKLRSRFMLKNTKEEKGIGISVTTDRREKTIPQNETFKPRASKRHQQSRARSRTQEIAHIYDEKVRSLRSRTQDFTRNSKSTRNSPKAKLRFDTSPRRATPSPPPRIPPLSPPPPRRGSNSSQSSLIESRRRIRSPSTSKAMSSLKGSSVTAGSENHMQASITAGSDNQVITSASSMESTSGALALTSRSKSKVDSVECGSIGSGESNVGMNMAVVAKSSLNVEDLPEQNLASPVGGVFSPSDKWDNVSDSQSKSPRRWSQSDFEVTHLQAPSPDDFKRKDTHSIKAKRKSKTNGNDNTVQKFGWTLENPKIVDGKVISRQHQVENTFQELKGAKSRSSSMPSIPGDDDSKAPIGKTSQEHHRSYMGGIRMSMSKPPPAPRRRALTCDDSHGNKKKSPPPLPARVRMKSATADIHTPFPSPCEREQKRKLTYKLKDRSGVPLHDVEQYRDDNPSNLPRYIDARINKRSISQPEWKLLPEIRKESRGLSSAKMSRSHLNRRSLPHLPKKNLQGLSSCLADPLFKHEFSQYLLQQHAAESLNFLDAVEAYSRIKGLKRRRAAALNIIGEFLAENAPQQLNVSDKLLNLLLEDATKGNFQSDLFRGIYAEVFSLLERDSFMRFKFKFTSKQRDEAEPDNMVLMRRILRRRRVRQSYTVVAMEETLDELMEIKKYYYSHKSVRTRWAKLHRFESSFYGHDFVTWLVDTNRCSSRERAVLIGQRMMDNGMFMQVSGSISHSAEFWDSENRLYAFTSLVSKLSVYNVLRKFHYIYDFLLIKGHFNYSRLFCMLVEERKRLHFYHTQNDEAELFTVNLIGSTAILSEAKSSQAHFSTQSTKEPQKLFTYASYNNDFFNQSKERMISLDGKRDVQISSPSSDGLNSIVGSPVAKKTLRKPDSHSLSQKDSHISEMEFNSKLRAHLGRPTSSRVSPKGKNCVTEAAQGDRSATTANGRALRISYLNLLTSKRLLIFRFESNELRLKWIEAFRSVGVTIVDGDGEPWKDSNRKEARRYRSMSTTTMTIARSK
eukprot:jgi/Bigna1/88269/estExt_fgenesh1_pg.C_300022